MRAEHLTEEGVAESMSVESVSPPLSEDLLNRGAPISVSTNIVDKSPNGQCDQRSQDEDGIIEEKVKLDAESREGDNRQCDQGSQDVDGMTKEEVRLDVESREGNSGTEEMVTRNEKTEPSFLAPQNSHDDDILIEVQHDIPSEPAAGIRSPSYIETFACSSVLFPESGIVSQVADADNQENFDRKVIDKSLESTLHVCSSILRQSSGDLKGQKVAVALETPVLGNKQDELPVLPAAAIAAAASVAKAAAAAAKLASDAALQAKLMADEFMVSNESIKLGPGNGVAFSNGAKLVGEVTPASILKGENRGNSSSSVISAAKEATRRKIESALAASKHAENSDAIVKAAELAAEAVALAGRVVALGNPLPLSALEESGPKGYGKLSQHPPEQLLVANSVKEVSLNMKLMMEKLIYLRNPQLEGQTQGHLNTLNLKIHLLQEFPP